MELLSIQNLKTRKLGNGFIFILDQGAEGGKNKGYSKKICWILCCFFELSTLVKGLHVARASLSKQQTEQCYLRCKGKRLGCNKG